MLGERGPAMNPVKCARPGCHNLIDRKPGTGRRSRYCNERECGNARNRDRRKHAPVFITCPVCQEVVQRITPNQVTCTNPECKAERKRQSEKNRVVRVPGVIVDRGARLSGIDRGSREGFKRYWGARPFHFELQFGKATIEKAWAMVNGRAA